MHPDSSLSVSLVIPVYGSAEIVPHLCLAIHEALRGYDYQVVLVNDCSLDASWSAIAAEAEKDSRVTGIDLRRNVGQDRAIMAGLNYVTGDYAVIMDDDLQHDPADIPKLIEAIRICGDVVYANFNTKKQSLLKNFMSWGAGKAAELVMRKPPHIYLSPFKIIKRAVVDQMIRYDGPFAYVDGLLFQVTGNIEQIDVEHHERFSGSTTHTFWKQAHLFLTLATNFSVLPLRLISVLGAICAVFSFLLGIYFLGVYFFKGAVVVGWTALALINLFIGGMVLLSLGMIGEYIGRILMNVNQIPQFVVRRIVNNLQVERSGEYLDDSGR